MIGEDAAQDRYWSEIARAVLQQSATRLVLDLGCGTGEWMQRYADWFAQYRFVGFDLSRERVRQAASRTQASGRCFVLVAAAEHLPFRKSAFGAVMCKVVVPYVWLGPTITELHRTMAPGAVMALQIHSWAHYREILYRGIAAASPRLIGYALWVIVNSLFLAAFGRQTRAFTLGRPGAPHVFLSEKQVRHLFAFAAVSRHPGGPPGGPGFSLVESRTRAAG